MVLSIIDLSGFEDWCCRESEIRRALDALDDVLGLGRYEVRPYYPVRAAGGRRLILLGDTP